MALRAALALALGIGVAAAGASATAFASARGAAQQPAPAAWGLAADWPSGDEDVLGLWGLPDGGFYAVSQPRRTAVDHPALSRRDAGGRTLWSRVVRGEAGRELRPIAAAADAAGQVYLLTADRLLAQDAAGNLLWEAPAGDAHPDFGPAARGLSLDPAAALLYGTDLVQARVLGYRASDGQRRLRLGTPGQGPGSFLAPIDLAWLPADGAQGLGGRLVVAEQGNRRLQTLDALGNPTGSLGLPAAPRALTAAADGRALYVLLADETVRRVDLGPGGGGQVSPPLFGGWGHGPGRFTGAWDLTLAGERLLVADRGGRRIQAFQPLDDPPPPAASATPGGAEPEPDPGGPPPLLLAACPGRPARWRWDLDLPAAPPRVDLLLVIDSTGSMESLISTVQARTAAIAAGLRAQSPDLALGLVDVRDFPYGQAGLPSDWSWQLRGALSADEADLAAAAATLYAGGGGDAPEAYASAIAGALDSPLTAWRPDARRVLVLLGDSVPRDDDLNAGVPNPRLPGLWAPGRPAWWKDSGPDLTPQTADDLDWQALLDRLRAEEVALLAVVTGAAPPELGGLSVELTRYWSAWTSRAGPGGAALELSNVDRLPEALAGLLGGTGRRIGRLEPRLGPAEAASWLGSEPPAHLGLDVPPGGRAVGFDLSLEAPPETPAGRYPLRLEALGDGARYGGRALELDWRPACAPTPSPSPAGQATPPEPTATAPPPSATATATSTATARPSATATPTARPARLFLPFLARGHCLSLRRRPLDLVLLLDSSQSMAGAPLQASRAAAGLLLDAMDLPRDRAALISFHGRAQLAAGLTGSRSLLDLALDRPQTGQGTRIDLGLAAALEELSGPRARPEALPVIVLLTDGRSDAGSEAAAQDLARRLRARGVVLYAVALGTGVDLPWLLDLVGHPDRLLPAPSPADLAEVYRALAVGLPCG